MQMYFNDNEYHIFNKIKVGQPKLLGQMKNQLLGEKKKDFLVANG